MSTIITFSDLIQDRINKLSKEDFLEHLEASLHRINVTYAKDNRAYETLQRCTLDILTFTHTAITQGLSKYITNFKSDLKENHVKYGSNNTFLTKITYMRRYRRANTYQDSYLLRVNNQDLDVAKSYSNTILFITDKETVNFDDLIVEDGIIEYLPKFKDLLGYLIDYLAYHQPSSERDVTKMK
jgi:hypothetical protein|nr:MAG TPA: hypothetical protein [Caudoviricetes sp.]